MGNPIRPVHYVRGPPTPHVLVIEKFNDDWRVTELETTAERKPKKK